MTASGSAIAVGGHLTSGCGKNRAWVKERRVCHCTSRLLQRSRFRSKLEALWGDAHHSVGNEEAASGRLYTQWRKTVPQSHDFQLANVTQ